ncbi:MAG: hypothetical protein AAFZ87_15480, partial [Planctomycetota bacterium]
MKSLLALSALLVAPVVASQSSEVVLHVGKVFTMDATDAVHAPGMVCFADGRLTYVGPIVERPGGGEPRVLH